MRGLNLATYDVPLGPSGTAPEGIHLLPSGNMAARDGRKWALSDPVAVMQAFQAGGIDLPVAFEHQNDKPEAKLKGPVPAAGWIKELKTEVSGIWGRVEWTATAREMIRNKEYRFLSPSFLFNPENGQVIRLKGAGLVHNSALHLTALANQENPMDMQPTVDQSLVQGIADMLGLPVDKSAKELLAKLSERLNAQPDPAKFMPVTAVQAMLKDRNLEIATASETRAKEKVEQAFRKGHFHGGMRDWALALCRSDEAAFDSFVAASSPMFGHLLKETNLRGAPPARAAVAEGSVAAAICEQLGLKPGALND